MLGRGQRQNSLLLNVFFYFTVFAVAGRTEREGQATYGGERSRGIPVRSGGHNYVGHNYIGHYYMGHNYIVAAYPFGSGGQKSLKSNFALLSMLGPSLIIIQGMPGIGANNYYPRHVGDWGQQSLSKACLGLGLGPLIIIQGMSGIGAPYHYPRHAWDWGPIQRSVAPALSGRMPKDDGSYEPLTERVPKVNQA